MKKIIIIFLFCVNQWVYSQVAVSYYPNTEYIGVSTNPTLPFWADLRLQVNTFAAYSNMEISPKLNLKRTEVVRIYIGTGVNFNVAYGLYDGRYLNGYLVSGGVMVSPFRSQRNLSFIFELSPYVNSTFTGGMIRSTLGISWHFKKKKKEEASQG